MTEQFQSLFPGESSRLSHKTRPPVLAYTSTPFRGLSLLITVFPYIKKIFPDIRLKIFSSMKVYQDEKLDERYRVLYQKCRELDGVNYVGSISQTKLAKELRSVTVLAYPNKFPETYCIAVSEALASGTCVVTSDLGALPETTFGYANLVPNKGELVEFSKSFFEEIIKILLKLQSSRSSEIDKQLKQQVNFINSHMTWKVIGTKWINLLMSLRYKNKVTL